MMKPSSPGSLRFSRLAGGLLLAFLNAKIAAGCFASIISFGDSIADTGNLLITGELPRIGRPPYGETFFHRPIGRFSDGRLIIDFIAEAIGFPFVRPFLAGVEGGEGFRYGANFAVGLATALDAAYFRSRGIDVPGAKYSLATQLKWFRQWLPTFCSSASDCDSLMSKSLSLVGEIGANDYNHPISLGSSISEVKAFVPDVVHAIGSATDDLAKLGARTMAVPGNFPIGCNAAFLTTFGNESLDEYNPQTGCLNWLNDFAMYHNHLLLEELARQRRRHPNVTIIYADYYEAAMSLYCSPREYGFKESPLSVCCGGGGPYNFNNSERCSDKGCTINLCNNPSKYISWDGIHMTEATYKAIADGLLGPYTTTPFTLTSLPRAKMERSQLPLLGSYSWFCNSSPLMLLPPQPSR